MPVNGFNIYYAVITASLEKPPLGYYLLAQSSMLILGVYLAYRLSIYRGWHEFKHWGLGPKEVQIRRRMLGEPGENNQERGP